MRRTRRLRRTSRRLPWSKPRYRVSLDEQAAFVLQEFSLAFAAGATRVEFYKLRNSADHPESIEPYGLLRGDDSRRPAFARVTRLPRPTSATSAPR